MSNKISEEKRKKIIELYTNGTNGVELSLTKIAELTDVCRRTVEKVITTEGIKTAKHFCSKNTTLNQDYWEDINTIDKSYFLGLFITDGCVCGRKCMLQLQSRDSYILGTLIRYVNSSNKLYYCKSRNTYSFEVSCLKWVQCLKKYNVIPNKTFTAHLPEELIKDLKSKGLLSHLIRGLIDGDGSIYHFIDCRGNYRQEIEFVGTETLVTQVRDILVSEIGVKRVKVRKTKNIFRVAWTVKDDVKKIGDYLYEDKVDCCLTRKFKKFEEILEKI